MIDEVYKTMKEETEKSNEALRHALSRVRSGRANAALLDSIRVDYYGTMTALTQMATISTPEPRMIMVKLFDRSSVSTVEKAIQASSLGLNPSSDGEIIRIPVPPLTQERRKELVKVVHKQGEESKVAVRNHRRDCNAMLKDIENDGAASKDDVARALKKVQDMTDAAIVEIDKILSAKEKEITEI
jgi:ribosome recycling factor